MEQIGWVGVGSLGLPMAANALSEGFSLRVYNRTSSKAKEIAERGASVVGRPVEAVVEGGILVSVLWDSETTEAIVSDEVLKKLRGGVHIGMCTGAPEAAKRLAQRHAQHGSAYVEAPVFGIPAAARARQLAIPFTGPEIAKERVRPLLIALGGKHLFDLGEQPGDATVLKQLGNFLIISAAHSLAEGLPIAAASGLDVLKAVEVLTSTLFPAPIYQNYGRALAEGKDTMSASAVPAKDIALFNQLAQRAQRTNPITNTLQRIIGDRK